MRICLNFYLLFRLPQFLTFSVIYITNKETDFSQFKGKKDLENIFQFIALM